MNLHAVTAATQTLAEFNVWIAVVDEGLRARGGH